jgi:hypothetical protein
MSNCNCSDYSFAFFMLALCFGIGSCSTILKFGDAAIIEAQNNKCEELKNDQN